MPIDAGSTRTKAVDASAPSSAVASATRSQGRTRLMFAVNPHTDDTTVPVGEVAGWGWTLLADHERFYPDGRTPPGQAVEPELFIPALGCSLWVAEG